MVDKVTIQCPRCGGQGYSNFWSGSGICFRCKGKGEVVIDVRAHEKALYFLRNKYRETKINLKHEKDPYEIEFLKRRLGYIKVDGQRVRAELDYVKAILDEVEND